MRRCKVCKVALDGILSILPRVLLDVHPSSLQDDLCNKCEGKLSGSKNSPLRGNTHPDEDGQSLEKTYMCQICKRMIHEDHALEHIKAEEYLLALIKKDHPRWHDKEPTCHECVEYYRKLVSDGEI